MIFSPLPRILIAAAALVAVCKSASAADQPNGAIATTTAPAIERAISEQRYLDAGTLLDEALLTKGDDAELILLAGDLSLAKGDAEQADSTFQRIPASSPYYTRAQEGLGIAESLLGHSEQAIGILVRVTSTDAEAWRAWNALGTEYDRRHDWVKADDAYSKALRGGSAIVLNNRGYSRLSQARLDDAIADFVAALNAKPDLKQARTNLRLALAMKGDYARAIEGADANDQSVLNNNAGFVAMMRGDYQEAKKLLTAAAASRGQYYAIASANLSTAEALDEDSAGKAK